ncbi:MAG: hypothetical protein ACFFGZ_08940 [Candidatus Thorarchaeota archaeon]
MRLATSIPLVVLLSVLLVSAFWFPPVSSLAYNPESNQDEGEERNGNENEHRDVFKGERTENTSDVLSWGLVFILLLGTVFTLIRFLWALIAPL